ncbi:hypothetical protein OCU04_005011 [Sclerotinia nivalis]|uniref:Uncharacterized protein n=1 Tax=Sclerotinia nivalis TaxID=352851 RepID=A0A9X0DLE8_9HELO|nr:hypothetical protein OCU04_005011 [Sclerotinia nivalis]
MKVFEANSRLLLLRSTIPVSSGGYKSSRNRLVEIQVRDSTVVPTAAKNSTKVILLNKDTSAKGSVIEVVSRTKVAVEVTESLDISIRSTLFMPIRHILSL